MVDSERCLRASSGHDPLSLFIFSSRPIIASDSSAQEPTGQTSVSSGEQPRQALTPKIEGKGHQSALSVSVLMSGYSPKDSDESCGDSSAHAASCSADSSTSIFGKSQCASNLADMFVPQTAIAT
eukprot:3020316-Amphidinium_carterae.1